MAVDIGKNIASVRERIEKAALRAVRDPSEVQLVAVTKTVSVDEINRAINAGIEIIGENRVQEAREKHGAIGERVRWHMVGHLQRNKVKEALGIFEMIHSVDSIRLALAIDEEAGKRSMVVPIMIEVNISGEEAKYGVLPGEVGDMLKAISSYKSVRLCGLMTMAPFVSDAGEVRPVYRGLRRLRDELRESGFNMSYLSMGMTQDFEVAIEEGATHVRIGSAIFGPRNY